MNEKKRFYVFLALIGIQVLFLVGLMLSRVLILAAGETLWLETEPIDPHSYFRGRYVILNYEFSRITVKGTYPEETPVYVILKPGKDRIYRRESFVFEFPSEKEPGQLVLKGKIKRSYQKSRRVLKFKALPERVFDENSFSEEDLKKWEKEPSFFLPADEKGRVYFKCADKVREKAERCAKKPVFESRIEKEIESDLFIDYGIENYFASETIAPWLEEQGRKGLIVAEAAVSSGGKAILRKLWVNGKEY